jgi:hypothetical protein
VVDADDDAPLESRPPTLSDLVSLCRRLHAEAARFVVVGGMAVIQAGFVRATEDIDLLIDPSPENVERVRNALAALPDGAARDLALDDVENYVVVRVADEIVVDLMKAACGVDYAAASGGVELVEIEGVSIPFANAETLWKTKQTVRDKDRLDREFLARLLRRPNRPGD